MKRGTHVSMQQLMHRSKATAARTLQTGCVVKSATGVKAAFRRIETIQNYECNDDTKCCRQAHWQAPLPRLAHKWWNVRHSSESAGAKLHTNGSNRFPPLVTMPTTALTIARLPENILPHGCSGACLAAIPERAALQTNPNTCATKPRIATMIKPIAGPFTNCAASLAMEPGKAAGIGPGAGPGAGAVKIAANSGISASVFQSPVPSSKTRVCPFARPSAIHCRNWSAVIGPYSLPSAPMILYIVFLQSEFPLLPMARRFPPQKQASNSTQSSARGFPNAFAGNRPIGRQAADF